MRGRGGHERGGKGGMEGGCEREGKALEGGQGHEEGARGCKGRR